MKYRIMSIVFALCLLGAAVMFFAGKGDAKNENREAAKIPDFTAENIKSGAFSDGFDAYVDDKIAYRSDIISLSQKIAAYKGENVPDGKIIRAEVDKGTGTKQSSNLLILNGAVMEMFEKNHTAADKYADALNKLYEKYKDDAKIYSMLVPTQLEFKDEIYSNLQDSQREEIDYIYEKTDGIQRINVYDTLKNHSGEYIYFRTDHHWTMTGAYYAYRELCAASGYDAVDISDYEKHEIENFTGYLSAFAAEENLSSDTIEWYDVNTRGNIDWFMKAYEDGKSRVYRSTLYDKSRNDYDFFLGSDHAFACFTNSDLPNGETIVVICDSYANDFVPWLMNNFKNVIMIDPRTYKDSVKTLFDEYHPDDVLVLNYIFTASFEDYCDKLLSIIE